MLKTRILTAISLLAVLLPILYFGYFVPFAVVAAIFFGCAMWESLRLFSSPAPKLIALIWVILFGFLITRPTANLQVLFILSCVIWVVRLLPALKFGLPDVNVSRTSNLVVSALYNVSIFACFAAIAVLFLHSPLYLLSVMAIVWIADVGAYFSGKAFGRRKLAPTISPGKSWEGAIGGWLAVIVIGAVVAYQVDGSFPAEMRARFGLLGLFVILSLLSVASVTGDLFESLIKRRAQKKDSSNLLPGHGGVLDRVDALIPVLPLAALLNYLW